MGPGPTSFSPAPPATASLDHGPSLLLTLFYFAWSVVIAVAWIKALLWARRQDRRDQDAETVRAIEELTMREGV